MNFLIIATVFFQTTEPVGVPSWVPIVIAVILLLLFWWGLSRNSIPRGTVSHTDDHHGDDHAPQVRNEPHSAHHNVAAATIADAKLESIEPATGPLPETAVTPDNLKIIEGIGPKIERILHEAGIKTFAELAAASVSELEKIVREDAGIRVAFPDTWPEQAQLAIEENWAKLEQLQEDLKGGRRA